ncbi:hypothetical protein HPP92_021907 [Vanilla planifolia]|uniref:beta-carotene 3-hydroxylase n=1 Tax=Vanilla planifolia TaxID=51239 RepID=A0A835PW30_VANPL|nr:hypothetical protein HPP92_022234 [Vanilla planifolia]KAG0458779.1 hypothetical protein HPP92_021907 [Vanilla planifolia]
MASSFSFASTRIPSSVLPATGGGYVLLMDSLRTPRSLQSTANTTELAIRPLLRRPNRNAALCFVLKKEGEAGPLSADMAKSEKGISARSAQKRAERQIYLFAAMMSSLGFTSMAAAAVYYRFAMQTEGLEIPLVEMVGTFSLAVGATVGMEYWARWAHRALWHASLWHMHKSHHRPRDGPFELNDIFAVINAAPAVCLLAFGFFNRGLIPSLCFGAGLGITLFGMAYMFVHDGLVHRRFPVGPIANVPYFRRVAAAHQLHHADKFGGVPHGLFLGPAELEDVGGGEELQKEINRRTKVYDKASDGSI